MEASSSNNRRQQAPNSILAVRSRMSNGLPHGIPPNGVPHQGNGGTMTPSWHGFIHDTIDALRVLEACLQGTLHHIPRRPHDRERGSIIASGNVFIYEENASGIKRWTDGVTWSPSRIMGNFLVYRELDEPFPAGEKKKAKKRKRVAEQKDSAEQLSAQSEQDRQLVGSLVDSYGFKPGGLIKKTLNVKYNGVNHHIVSYYNVADVKAGLFGRPGYDSRLVHLTPRQELFNCNSFKAGIELEQQYSQAIYGESPQDMAQMMPMSMPGTQIDSPLGTHASGFSSVGHSPSQQMQPHQIQLSGHPSNQYVQQSQPQYVQSYPVYSPSLLDPVSTAMHGSMGSGFDFNPIQVTSSQGTAFDMNQMNPTALPANSPYHYECVPPSSPLSQQLWQEEDADDSKAPSPKRRQTMESLRAAICTTPSFLASTNNFSNTHHTGGGLNQDCHYPFEPYYNGFSLMLPEQGIARAH